MRRGNARLVKKAVERPHEKVVDTAYWLDMNGYNDYNVRGLGGGGQCKVHNLKQRARPAKNRHFCTRRAHPTIKGW